MIQLVLKPEEMREADRITIEQVGIPALTLMENAGKSVAEEIIKRFGKGLKEKKVAVFCGKGNNGGDGFVTAIHLKKRCKEITVYIFSNEDEFSEDAKYQLVRARKAGLLIKPANDFLSENKKFDIYVDAIFGTGFKGAVSGIYKEVIERLNGSPGYKVACDIPSGVNGETGEVESVAFKANLTVTFAFLKTGLLLYPGRYFAGEIVLSDIGIPGDVLNPRRYIPSLAYIKTLLPTYIGNEHKGIAGKVLIVAGSKEYTGAGYLCSESAVRSGAGLVFLAVPEEIRPIMQSKLNEVIVRSYNNIGDFRKILEGDYDAIAFGPGLGRRDLTVSMLEEVLKFPRWKVIDADGIWALSEAKIRADEKTLITPHPGEASFLLNALKPSEVDKKRVDIAPELVRITGGTAVLKGAPTVISDGKETWINPTGNPGMAVGGMGDVLTGIIAGLLPRVKDPLKSAILSVCIHGLSADLLLTDETYETITPTKVIENLGKAFKVLRN